jgi:hypothetical protein
VIDETAGVGSIERRMQDGTQVCAEFGDGEGQ